ncbi:hypothetical protein RD792_002445 [Penstemon davidsonii]|uniref:RING-type domain-containing protein n=1 Tax=Penstemon davidsonii TaxID=160366 RepID=A0ABR0DR23_9LAMI|nr:hypothetical protein RD792_002445 [Penstemon davidsonii]
MYVSGGSPMRKSFKDSLKVLEADIQHANTLASDLSREYDGACLQMRLSYSPAAHLFLFLVQWTDCHLAGALGLLRILIYKVYVDGTTTMTTHERKASIREFYAVIYPSLVQLQRGVTDSEDKKQKAVCLERYKRRDEEEHRVSSELDIEREEECGICMETNSRIVLPNCNHVMCLKCYRDWRTRSQSCPFCRDSLKRVNSSDLWVFLDSKDVIDMAAITRENLKRLFMYIDKLPLIIPDNLFDNYDTHVRTGQVGKVGKTGVVGSETSPVKISSHFLRFQLQNRSSNYTFKTLSLSSQSLSYGGWDEFQLGSDSGESNQLHNFLDSVGIRDKKYVFVYLLGFVCALAISRVKVSSIIVFPACAIVFALGFSVGIVKGGHLKELKVNGNKRKPIDETFRGSLEELRNLGDNLKGYRDNVLNLKNDIRRGIKCNQVTLSDLDGYINVIESSDISFLDAINAVESCINQEKEGGVDQESSGQRKKSNEMGRNFSQYFNGFLKEKLDGSNILAASVKERNLDSAQNGKVENKSASKSSNPFHSTVGTRIVAENLVNEDEKRNVSEKNDTDEAVFDETMYCYQNNSSRFVNNKQVYVKDYEDEIERMESRKDSYDSVDLRISMNHKKTEASFGHHQKRRTLNRNYSHFASTEEDETESQQYSYKKEIFSPENEHFFANQESPSSVLGDDLEFNNYLAEANDLFKKAKSSLRQRVNDGRAEHALHKSALLLSKAMDIRPMSLLAVGQLGNTYLLHGELKLRTSKELRSLLTRTGPSSVEEWRKVLDRFNDELANNKDKMALALVDVCEECEELLIKAGRNYKLALSIDGNDMRALYNWGLALSFRAQLIADIGPTAARDADKVFLAAIDKFDAMMSKSNVYAPDALFRWGAALQHRSRLRPRKSKEKVKLLQQARRLYEDALHIDSGNLQLQEALSSCASELDSWYG